MGQSGSLWESAVRRALCEHSLHGRVVRPTSSQARVQTQRKLSKGPDPFAGSGMEPPIHTSLPLGDRLVGQTDVMVGGLEDEIQ